MGALYSSRRPYGPWWWRFLIAVPVTAALLAGFLIAPTAVVVAGARTGLQMWQDLPTSLAVPDTLPTRSTIYAADGTVIASFYAENRVPLPLEDIPDSVIGAVIATEDSRFYDHHGVDWFGTARAFWNNARGLPQQGGSGITQQYVKNLLVLAADSEADVQAAKGDTYERKIQEARYAMALEDTLTKDQILENYLNTVYFGDGAYGIGAAAQHYFNTDAADLTLGQSALLAGIINNPSRFDPTRDMAASKSRREHVLRRMAAEGYITAEQATAAANEPVVLDLVVPANGCVASAYPMYCQWVRDTLANDPAFGETAEQRQEFLYQGGLQVYTAMDPKVQRDAEKAARKALKPKGRVATAIAVVQPGTGHVVAIATNKTFGQDKGQTELILPVRAKFQNGSTFKPLTAAAALEQGINPTLILESKATYIPGNNRKYPEGGFHNAGDGPGGTMDMAAALRGSVNTWFVMLEDQLGVLPVARVAKNMGLTSLPLDGPNALTEKDAALTLGAWDTSPVQVANSFATLAAHGVACNPVNITRVVGPDGTDVPVPEPNCRQVIRASTADTVTDMLTGVIYHPGGTGFRAKLDGDRPAAGKTGSTNDYGAAWFAGYTPQYATAVWVGDPRGPQYNMDDGITAYGEFVRPVYGGTVPALIWKDTMDRVHKKLPVQRFAPPGGDAAIGVPNIIPDVRGLTPSVAFRLLEDAGFTPVLVRGEGTPIPGMRPGTVSRTVPTAGTQVAITGRSVRVLVPDGE